MMSNGEKGKGKGSWLKKVESILSEGGRREREQHYVYGEEAEGSGLFDLIVVVRRDCCTSEAQHQF